MTQIFDLLFKYSVPVNLNSWWNYGFLAGMFLSVQLVTGIFLTFFYIPQSDLAYSSVQTIMREINYGWLIRYIHLNGAAFFFLVVYLHMARSLYYKSYFYPRTNVWLVGVVIFFCMMGTAFLGYVLPWGQMSFWAATVITNFLTAIPIVGKNITYIVWGGYSINEMTLTRFFSLHYLLPFVISLLSLYHILLLHKTRSSTPIGIHIKKISYVEFHPYFTTKDQLFLIYYFIGFFIILGLVDPELLNHSDNYIPADPMVTPPHIVPEIYFLPFYGVLKTISNKLIGIIAMFLSIFILFILPYLFNTAQKKKLNLIKYKNNRHKKRIMIFVSNFIFLGYIGSESPNYPWVNIGIVINHIYILLFILINNVDLMQFQYKPLISKNTKKLIKTNTTGC